MVQVVAPTPAGAGPRLPPVSVTDDGGPGKLVSMPEHVVVRHAGDGTRLAGRVSVNVIGASVAWLKLLTVTVRVAVPPRRDG